MALIFIGSVLLWNVKVILENGLQMQIYMTDDTEEICKPSTGAEYIVEDDK